MKLTIEKADLLKILEKINNGSILLPQQETFAFIKGKAPSEKFEEFVNSLMLAVTSLIEKNDPTVTTVGAKVLPKSVVPFKIKF